MDFRELRTYLPELYASGAAVYLEGPPGVGKSSFAASLPTLFGPGFGFHKFDASSVDPAEPPGFIAPVKDADGEAVAKYLRSALMPSKEYLAEHPRGILLVDEWPATSQAVRHALDSVILERRFGHRHLPDGWRVWAAGNRVADMSGAQRLEAKARNRVTTIPIDFKVSQWVEDYAIPRKLDPLCLAFAENNPNIFADKVPSEAKPFCTPRSFTMMAEFWGVLPPEKRLGAFQIIAGWIGDGPASTFQAYAEHSTELPTMKELLADPMGCKVPKRSDMKYAALMLATSLALQGESVTPCWRYISRLPAELHYPALERWSRDPRVRSRFHESAELVQYVGKNHKHILELWK